MSKLPKDDNSTKANYSCPMHPEVISDKPDSCPKCGMALEQEISFDAPSSAQSQEAEDPEMIDMKRRFVVALVFSSPIMLIMLLHLLGVQAPTFGVSINVIQLLLALPVCSWCAWPFYVRGVNSIKFRSLNMFTLIGVGVSVTFFYSLVAVAFPFLFPPEMRQADGSVAVYFESAAMIVTLVLLGQVLELRARGKTSTALKALLNLVPPSATIIHSCGSERVVPLAALKIGDIVVIKPGEKIPVDGAAIEGESHVDESMLNGEAIPQRKTIGDALVGGSINGTGFLKMKVDQVGADTVLARIVDAVAKAQKSRAQLQKLADQVAAIFVPLVMVISLVTFLVWTLIVPGDGISYGIVNAVAVLMIACPCALGLATPISIMVASGKAAGMGVLFRDAQAIEELAKIDCLVMDKTGTLTQGQAKVEKIILDKKASKFDEQEILALVAATEAQSEHPIAKAIVNYALERGVKFGRGSKFKASNFQGTTGIGVSATVAKQSVSIGSEKSLEDLPAAIAQETTKLREGGAGIIFASVNKKFAAAIVIRDPIKPEAKQTLAQLKDMGINLVMLTGDNATNAKHTAGQLGIEKVFASALPLEKAQHIAKLQSEGHKVAMMGDGINDAVALAGANVGIAMGNGTDVALEAANVALLKGNLEGALKAITLARATIKNIKQNLVFAFGYNLLGVPIAAGVLYPFLGILLSPIIAAAAMSLSSVSVISNALRLK